MSPSVAMHPLATLLAFQSREGTSTARLPEHGRKLGTAAETPAVHRPTSLKSIFPRIGITTRTLKKLEAIQLVREQRDARTQEVSYNARPFVLCGLPLRRPSADELVYTRRNGSFVLEVTAHPRFGLPYGQDRLAGC